jgi:hypothetical protein
MTSTSNYTIPVFPKDNTITISTLSPNGQYFYKIKTPKEFYKGAFCSQIAFFDIDKNLLYHKQNQYGQFGFSENKPWEIVSWSKSGNIAYFVERDSLDSNLLYHILIDLKNKEVSRTEFDFTDKDKWTSELFHNLPEDDARESYLKIISTPNDEINNVFTYVSTLDLIKDKTELVESLKQYYYSDNKRLLQQLENGNFEDEIVKNTYFNKFTTIVPDKIKLNVFEFLWLWTWRPRQK